MTTDTRPCIEIQRIRDAVLIPPGLSPVPVALISDTEGNPVPAAGTPIVTAATPAPAQPAANNMCWNPAPKIPPVHAAGTYAGEKCVVYSVDAYMRASGEALAGAVLERFAHDGSRIVHAHVGSDHRIDNALEADNKAFRGAKRVDPALARATIDETYGPQAAPGIYWIEIPQPEPTPTIADAYIAPTED